ncbi:MAG: VIT1/CCC1 transporter family protein [Candidatus Izemoplasmatales bacterium]|nr:VIT1/CCC1 transporter family protein [Candidatus Izemoplasmatales bacterium]
MNDIPKAISLKIKSMQRGEITEYYVYKNIAKRVKDASNKEILLKIANDEMRHYNVWKTFLGEEAKPNRLKIFYFTTLAFLFGYTFTLKLMERGEDRANDYYTEIGEYSDQAKQIAMEEDEHEKALIGMLDEERLSYVGSMVLGLNDALVELSGALAGLTFAFTDTKLISLSGLITGIAASLSMAASQYLSSKADGRPDALKSSVYTGIAYVVTVAILITPYLLLGNQYIALGVMLFSVVLIIFLFNYYISVAKDLEFKKRFFQMAIISLSVAVISFFIGILVKKFLGVDI